MVLKMRKESWKTLKKLHLLKSPYILFYSSVNATSSYEKHYKVNVQVNFLSTSTSQAWGTDSQVTDQIDLPLQILQGSTSLFAVMKVLKK